MVQIFSASGEAVLAAGSPFIGRPLTIRYESSAAEGARLQNIVLDQPSSSVNRTTGAIQLQTTRGGNLLGSLLPSRVAGEAGNVVASHFMVTVTPADSDNTSQVPSLRVDALHKQPRTLQDGTVIPRGFVESIESPGWILLTSFPQLLKGDVCTVKITFPADGMWLWTVSVSDE